MGLRPGKILEGSRVRKISLYYLELHPTSLMKLADATLYGGKR